MRQKWIRRAMILGTTALAALACQAPAPATTADAALADDADASDVPDAAPGADATDAADAAPAIDAAIEDQTPSVDVAAGAAFGERCSSYKPKIACAPGLFCLKAPSGKSFCSQTCPSQGKPCEGAPEGTAAFCIVTDVNSAGDGGCAFVCATKAGDFDCPADLTCQPGQEPPGSGQQLCFPE